MRSTSGHLRAAFLLLAIALVALVAALGPAAVPAQGATPSSVSAYVVLPDRDDDDGRDRDRRDRDDDRDRDDNDDGRDRDRDGDRGRGDRDGDRRGDDGDDEDRRDSNRDDDDGDRDQDRDRDRDNNRDNDGDGDRDNDRDNRDNDRDRDRDRDENKEKERTPARHPATFASPPPPPPSPAPAPRTASAFSAIVRIRGRVTTRGARLTLLGVRAPRGALVVGRCLGRACSVRRQAARARSPVALRRFHRHFRAGTVIVVRVTMPGQIGKFTRFTIRRGKPPLRRDLCLAPGVRRPVNCP